MQRVNELLTNAHLESCGKIDGVSNIDAILNENISVQEQFLKALPLEQAIATSNIEAVNLLVSKGQVYNEWSELVDKNTPLYSVLSNDTKDVNATVLNLSNDTYHNFLKSYTPEEIYSLSQDSIKQILGIADVAYMSLTDAQRMVVNNKLLYITKHFYDATNQPVFLLYDFAVLYDANLWLGREYNPELLLALDNHINTQINYLAGYCALNSSPPAQFMGWAENTAKHQGCPIEKVLCTNFYELCKDEKLKNELASRMILDSALAAKDIVYINSNLKNALLCDGGSLDPEYKASLEKSCGYILSKFDAHDEFISALNASDFSEIFAPISQRELEKQKRADNWEHSQAEFLQALLKEAKRESILQQASGLQQDRCQKFNDEFNNKYNYYVALIDRYNQIVTEYNIAATLANDSYKESAQHQDNAKLWLASAYNHSSNYQAMSQSISGTAPASHTVAFTVDARSENGLSLTQSHTINKGHNVIAHASSTYNSRTSYGQKINAILAMAQARKNAAEVSVECARQFTDLARFVDSNNQYLHDFEVPEFTLTNPYSENKLIFADGVGNGLMGYNNFGLKVVENTLSVDREEMVQQFYSTAASPLSTNNFKADADSSFYNIAVENLSQDWRPLTQEINQNSSFWGAVTRGVSNGVLTALTLVTGSSVAEASPLVASGAFAGVPAAAAPAVSSHGSASHPPMTFKRLGMELLDAAQKTLLVATVLAHPDASTDIIHQILITPMHEINPNDSLLPGSYGNDIDTSIPAYEATDYDNEYNNTGHSSSSPDIEETSIPPYSAYDGESLLLMYKNVWDSSSKDNKSSTTLKCDYIFRGTKTKPEHVFVNGFQRYGDLDLHRHIEANEGSGFISTSKSPNVAREFEFVSSGDYVYVIKKQNHGIDVNMTLGEASKYPYEQEIAVPNLISSKDIMGARMVGSGNKLTGPFIKNSNYRP